MEGKVSINFHWKPLEEILAQAIKSEVEAAATYRGLYHRLKNRTVQQKLLFLAFEEEQHRKILERLFSQRFPARKLEIPKKSFIPRIRVSMDEKSSIIELFQATLRAEKNSEEFYREAEAKSEDKQSKKLLSYLKRVERSHYFIIKSEIDLLSRFPDYYQVEDFHLGEEMIHVGP